jgi:hypothetical protein
MIEKSATEAQTVVFAEFSVYITLDLTSYTPLVGRFLVFTYNKRKWGEFYYGNSRTEEVF